MNMTGRFKCPECTNGFSWKREYWWTGWKIEQCTLCKGHGWVLTNEDGTIKGPDAPPRYLCDHGERLTDHCVKCHPVPHKIEFTDEELIKEIHSGGW